MPFEPGMDNFLQTFAPIPLTTRLRLKPQPISLQKTRKKIASWYRTATALEAKKPMQKPLPILDAEKVMTRVDYAQGNSYKGEYANGKRHGKGQYVCESKGYLYRGEWEMDMIHGQGSMFIRQKDKTWFLEYIGDYKKGLRDGWGTFRKSDEEYYEGLWKLGKQEGWGRHFAPDGTIYEGQWHYDKRSGYGCTREGTGNHHVGEYLEDMKHGPGKYNYIQTGKCFRGTWKNGIPVLGEIIQLKIYKPSFPHQYPMPEIGVKDDKAILQSGMQDTSHVVPPRPLCALPCPEVRVEKQMEVEDTMPVRGRNNEDMDMRQILVDAQPEVAAVKDVYLARKTGDYLLAMEYLWRCTADRTQPRPVRVKKLFAQNSQELMAINNGD